MPIAWQYIETSAGSGKTLDTWTNYVNYVNSIFAAKSYTYVIIDVHKFVHLFDSGDKRAKGGPRQLCSLWHRQRTRAARLLAPELSLLLAVDRHRQAVRQSAPRNLWHCGSRRFPGSMWLMAGNPPAQMNEPHDLDSADAWTTSVQTAVTAIRNAGAKSQLLLLPGLEWSGADSFLNSGGAYQRLSQLKDYDGSTTLLAFDLHHCEQPPWTRLLRSRRSGLLRGADLDNNGGSSVTCQDNGISRTYSPIVSTLRSAGRIAMLTETGGGTNQGCINYLGQSLAYLNDNNDVFFGWTIWGAGNVPPFGVNDQYEDVRAPSTASAPALPSG